MSFRPIALAVALLWPAHGAAVESDPVTPPPGDSAASPCDSTTVGVVDHAPDIRDLCAILVIRPADGSPFLSVCGHPPGLDTLIGSEVTVTWYPRLCGPTAPGWCASICSFQPLSVSAETWGRVKASYRDGPR